MWILNAIIGGYFIVSIAFMRLRKTEPELERPYSMKDWRTTGVLVIGLSLLFFILLSKDAGLLIMAS
ncbi:hypothetical protein Saga11_30810 [Bacillus safensis]|nr:hypothetical protein Saga11_30810 [Bacillus safensis]